MPTLMRMTGCTGLQVSCTQLFCTVLDYTGLCWAVLGCNGLSCQVGHGCPGGQCGPGGPLVQVGQVVQVIYLVC